MVLAWMSPPYSDSPVRRTCNNPFWYCYCKGDYPSSGCVLGSATSELVHHDLQETVFQTCAHAAATPSPGTPRVKSHKLGDGSCAERTR